MVNQICPKDRFFFSQCQTSCAAIGRPGPWSLFGKRGAALGNRLKAPPPPRPHGFKHMLLPDREGGGAPSIALQAKDLPVCTVLPQKTG